MCIYNKLKMDTWPVLEEQSTADLTCSPVENLVEIFKVCDLPTANQLASTCMTFNFIFQNSQLIWSHYCDQINDQFEKQILIKKTNQTYRDVYKRYMETKHIVCDFSGICDQCVSQGLTMCVCPTKKYQPSRWIGRYTTGFINTDGFKIKFRSDVCDYYGNHTSYDELPTKDLGLLIQCLNGEVKSERGNLCSWTKDSPDLPIELAEWAVWRNLQKYLAYVIVSAPNLDRIWIIRYPCKVIHELSYVYEQCVANHVVDIMHKLFPEVVVETQLEFRTVGT